MLKLVVNAHFLLFFNALYLRNKIMILLYELHVRFY